MGESWDVLEALVGEGGAVVALTCGPPAKPSAQPVVVVVLDECSKRGLGVGEAFEAVAVAHVLLEDRPEGLDLAVRPRRADLSPQVLDVEVAQTLAEVGEYAWHPDHEGQAVIAHQLKRLAAKLEAFVQPGQDGFRPRLGQYPEPDHKSRVVVDHTDQPGLDVAAALEVDEEGTFDIDMPELVGLSPFITATWSRRHAAAGAAPGAQHAVAVAMAHLIDLAAPHLRRDSLGVPVRVQPDGDDDRIDPARDAWAHSEGATRGWYKPLDATLLKGEQPAVQRGSRATQLRTRSSNSKLGGQATSSHPSPDFVEARPGSLPCRTTVLSCQEEQARPLLVVVAPNRPTRVMLDCGVNLRHAGTVSPAFSDVCGNLN